MSTDGLYARQADGASAGSGAATDWPEPYHYTGWEVGQSHLQFETCRVFTDVGIRYFGARGRMVRVGGDLPFVYRKNDAKAKVMPDMYILDQEPQAGPKIPAWKTWEHEGKVPLVAIEVVSDTWKKDYTPEGAIQRYEEMGVPELLRYDPDWSAHPRSGRRLFAHFLRDESGRLVEQPQEGDQVHLKGVDLWVVHRRPYYLRIAQEGKGGKLRVVPTSEEALATQQRRTERAQARAQEANQRAAAEAERAKAEAERAKAEAERAEAEAERAERAERAQAAAEQQVAELLAELTRLKAAGQT